MESNQRKLQLHNPQLQYQYHSQGANKRSGVPMALSPGPGTVPRSMDPSNQSNPIQYVFIDESQRDSKRLKITRACESCRRRKVKCDAPHVPQGEPCTSCRRLLVDCVLQQQGTHENDDKYGSLTGSGDEDIVNDMSARAVPTISNSSGSSPPNSRKAGKSRERRPSDARRPPLSIGLNERSKTKSMNGPGSPDSTEFRGVDSITQVFGDIDIAFDGRAAFVTDEHGPRGLPPYTAQSFTSHVVGMPAPEQSGFPVVYEDMKNLLPDDKICRHLIDLYFGNLHPYLPVVNKMLFYSAWLGDRSTLSPFLLVSLLACSAGYSLDARLRPGAKHHAVIAELNALVLQYREIFQDAPRISTVQAEIINLKGLETRPNTPGYFYKSWFQLSCVIRIGRDLGLNCMKTSNAQDPDSITGRRVWQAGLILDQLMGSAQGREMQLDIREVDIGHLSNSHRDVHSLDSSEVRLHNDFLQLVAVMGILRRCTMIHAQSGVKFPFAAEPQYPTIARALSGWFASLPKHLQFNPMVDKKLPSHFVAHLHLTYSMITSVLHRPWVVSTGDYGSTGEWRDHLRVCNQASRRATILYEMVLDQYGEHGIRWMLRGNNYAMYGAVIATMIHVVCLSCPEQEFCTGAREFFNRTTKVLDRLCVINSTPQMMKQIAVLKGIFGTEHTPKEPLFDLHLLPPELASLQAQYTKMQEERAQSQSPRYYQPEPFQSTTNPNYTGAAAMYPDNMLFENGLTSPTSIAEHGTTWNPAGLIGAWNQNFPVASIGMLESSRLQYFNDEGYGGFPRREDQGERQRRMSEVYYPPGYQYDTYRP